MRRAIYLLAALVVSAPFPTLADQQFARIMDTGLPVSGGTLTGNLNMSGNDLWCVGDIEPTTTCELAADSAPTDSVIRTGQDAWPQAASNTTGGSVCILPGEGTNKFTVVNYALCSGKAIVVTVNGVAVTLTEGVHWTAATSNNSTASSQCAAIEAVTGVSCAASVGAVSPVKRDPGCYQVSISTGDAACTSIVSGTDGKLTLPNYPYFGSTGTAASGFRLDNSSGTLVIRDGAGGTTKAVYTYSYGTYRTDDAAFAAAGTGGGYRAGTTGRFAWSDNANGSLGTTDTYVMRDEAGVVGVNSVLRLTERTPPAAGAANTARIFAQDNGAGKTQLCVLFASGAAQCFATEP